MGDGERHDGTCSFCGSSVARGFVTCTGCGATWRPVTTAVGHLVFLGSILAGAAAFLVVAAGGSLMSASVAFVIVTFAVMCLGKSIRTNVWMR